ncbi:MAG: hypothetical protein U1A27_13370 [Phycisphaerae bacterium]
MTIHSARRSWAATVCLAAILIASAAEARITSVTGASSVQLTRLVHGTSDASVSDSHSFPPSTQPTLSTVQLDAPGLSGEFRGAAQASAVFTDSRTVFGFIPNDAGIDVAAFALDPAVAFEGNGHSSSTRTIRLSGADLRFPTSQPVTVRSSIFIAGALILAAGDASADLSGLQADITVSVLQTGGGTPGQVLHTSARLAGHANGQVNVESTGALAAVPLGAVDLLALSPQLQVPGIGVVRVVPFPVVALDYEYGVMVDQDFQLTAEFDVHIRTLAGNSAAAAIFGLPQISLPASMAKVRGDDAGQQLARAVSSLVDTTGRSGPPSRPLFGLCGAVGFEAWLAGAACVGWTMSRRRRRR